MADGFAAFCFCFALSVQPAFAGFDEAAAAFAVGDYDKALEEVRPLVDGYFDLRDAALEDEKNLGPNAPGYIP